MIFKTKKRTLRDFENDYRHMFGTWFDYHQYQLIQQYGDEKAAAIMEKNVEKLNKAVKKAIEDKERYEKERYDFAPIGAHEYVPFDAAGPAPDPLREAPVL